jgi:hypothetical protein
MEKMSNISIKEHGQKRPLRGLGYRQKANIKMDLKEIRYEHVEWI